MTCSLVGPTSTLDTADWYDGGITGYGEVVNQAVFTTASPTTVQLNCDGSNAGVYDKKLQAIRVSSASDNLGPNVAKTAVPQHLR